MPECTGKRPKVKICGITNLEDAREASDLGAELLGVVMDPASPRHGSQATVEEIAILGKEIVGVYTSMDMLRSSQLKEDTVQLHFEHSPDDIKEVKASLGKRVVSVVFLNDASDAISRINRYSSAGSDYILVEKKGISSSLPELRTILKDFDVGISGGIGTENIRSLAGLKPAFVDLSSSLESLPGKKDHRKMRDFFLELEGST
ncbi:MAG: phosphoribosylanthranilate isomerase [Candidatus Thermoplasmatota archaeon]|nr:phosphoribosylanthranilate isomerase [Candidatus Thermoplasmatota archaeon]